MNPQYPGQFGQGPPSGFDGQRQPGPPGPGPAPTSMYNGQPLSAPGQFGGPMKPVQNGPQPGQNAYGGPQGDSQFRAGGPGMFPPRGPPGQGQMGMPPRGPGPTAQPMRPGPGPGPMPPATNQMTNQLGAMNITGQPPRPGPPGGGNPPHSAGFGMPPSGPSMGQAPNSMAPPTSAGGQPTNMGMGPPPGMGPPLGGQPPHSSGPGAAPVSSSYNQPPGGFGQQPASSGYGAPPTSNFGPPPTSSFGAPPTSGFGPPPTSNFGAPPSSGFGPPPGGMPPSGVGGQPRMGMPPSSSGPPTGMTPPPGIGGQPISTGGFGQPVPPQGMDMRSQPNFAGQAPPSSMSGPNIAGYGQAPPSGFPPMSQGGMPAQGSGMQPDMSKGQFGGSGQQFSQGGFPGQSGPRPGAPGPSPGMQPPQQKRLDPDQMPSPIQVIEDDKRNRGGTFTTATRGHVPPLVTTQFVTQDQGNCNPSFMRSTMYNIPCTSDMLKNSHIPMALTVAPFANLLPEENMPPIVNLGELGPVRCKRCKAYMNPYMMFIDGGRRFQCAFCGAATDVPNEYFAHLDHTGRRVDSYDRPELFLGSYEFVATKDYCKTSDEYRSKVMQKVTELQLEFSFNTFDLYKNSALPNAPAFIFMIDVSYNSVKSGLVHLICERLKKDILVNLPRETGAEQSEIRVGFVTYDKEIHFYNVKSNLAQPQMLVVSDIEDVFVPLLDGFLVTLAESEAVIDSLLSQIPTMFGDSRETETVLGPVIQAGLDALKSADRAGKLYLFHTSLPIAEAPGKLKNRDDRKLLGTDKEKSILTPQTKFYSTLGEQCVSAGCSVDIFLFPNSYCDVATISDICRLTSGNMYKYSYFQADLDGDRFIEDLKTNVMSQRAFDAIVRIRTSQGIRPVDFLGNFYMSNTTDVEMCAIDSNQALCVEIKHDDKLNEQEGACIQVAALFTSVSGQRRLRVHNLALNCCTQLADLFRNCELDALINYMSKFAIRNVLNKTPREMREQIMVQVANILACYRKNCASPSSAGQLILPECMKLLPLYGNCVVKSDGIQGGQDISTDDRSYLMHLVNAMDVKSSSAFFYPQLVALHELEPKSTDFPMAMRCSADRLRDDGIYLLENGVSMFMWIGHNADPDWIQQVFSVQSAAQIDIDKCRLLELENEVSHRVRDIIKQVRANRNRYMKLTVVRQRDKLEPWFNHFLVEDKGLNGSASYVDFLCHIHKEIRNLLS